MTQLLQTVSLRGLCIGLESRREDVIILPVKCVCVSVCVCVCVFERERERERERVCVRVSEWVSV